MELVLKVYKNQKEVEKEYKIDSYDLMTGFVEDLLKAIDLDQLEGKSGNDLYIGIAKIGAKSKYTALKNSAFLEINCSLITSNEFDLYTFGCRVIARFWLWFVIILLVRFNLIKLKSSP